MDRIKKDLKITPQEMSRLSEAMKDEKFRDLLKEYMDEISDPKNKQEYDAYLSQLEQDSAFQNGQPQKLLRPQPGFVIKLPSSPKIFINICHSSLIEEATKTVIKSGPQGSGEQWHMPLTLSPSRSFTDTKGASCKAYDFVINTNTFKKYSNDSRVRNLMISMAIESVEKQEGAKLAAFKPIELKNVTHKGGTPPILTFNPASKPTPLDQIKPPSSSSSSSSSSNSSTNNKTNTSGNDNHPEKPQIIKEVLVSNTCDSSLSTSPATQSSSSSTSSCSSTSNTITPSYTITERGYFSISEYGFTGIPSSSSSLLPSRPKELLIRITLPGLSSISTVTLDLSTKTVCLKEETLNYSLSIDLPYKVDHDNGRAQFNKKTGILTITVSVLNLDEEEKRAIIDMYNNMIEEKRKKQEEKEKQEKQEEEAKEEQRRKQEQEAAEEETRRKEEEDNNKQLTERIQQETEQELVQVYSIPTISEESPSSSPVSPSNQVSPSSDNNSNNNNNNSNGHRTRSILKSPVLSPSNSEDADDSSSSSSELRKSRRVSFSDMDEVKLFGKHDKLVELDGDTNTKNDKHAKRKQGRAKGKHGNHYSPPMRFQTPSQASQLLDEDITTKLGDEFESKQTEATNSSPSSSPTTSDISDNSDSSNEHSPIVSPASGSTRETSECKKKKNKKKKKKSAKQPAALDTPESSSGQDRCNDGNANANEEEECKDDTIRPPSQDFVRVNPSINPLIGCSLSKPASSQSIATMPLKFSNKLLFQLD